MSSEENTQQILTLLSRNYTTDRFLGVLECFDLILQVGTFTALSKEGKEYALKNWREGIPDRRCAYRGRADY